ncbi:MAG: sulfur carrier protein ThiS adenylyltransferase ThiF [bacterium]
MNDFERSLRNYYSAKQLSLIQKTKIGIAGAGGLGSNIAVCLVRSGFRDFEMIDFDVVVMKNLNRQYYFLEDVGKPKVKALAERLKTINPDIMVKAERVRLSEENIGSYFRDRDIIFEAFDEAASKAWLLEQFGNDGTLLVFGSGMAGFGNQLEIKTRKIKNNIYIVGDGVTGVGSDNPPLAPRVTACASLMASIAVESILK